MVREKKPHFVFLMKTKCKKSRMESIRVRLGFESVFTMDPIGRNGGLALLWKDRDDLEIQNVSIYHINAIVKLVGEQEGWKFMSFYRNPNWTKQHESWELLQHLQLYSSMPWLCVGDFNEILCQEEKSGALLRRKSQMEQFRSALEICGLADLGYKRS